MAYVEQIVKHTPLCSVIPWTKIKCREKVDDDTKKFVSNLVKYSRGLCVILDDCEGNPAAERVWPKDARNVHVLKPYDCLEEANSKSHVLDHARRVFQKVHREFY